jgi:hypothetical protein
MNVQAPAGALSKESMGRPFWNQRLETIPRAQLDALHLARIQRLVTYAYENTDFYRRKLDAAGKLRELRPGHLRGRHRDNLLPRLPRGRLRVGVWRERMLDLRRGHLLRVHWRPLGGGVPPLPRGRL